MSQERLSVVCSGDWGAGGACELMEVTWDSEKLEGFGPTGGIDIIVGVTRTRAPLYGEDDVIRGFRGTGDVVRGGSIRTALGRGVTRGLTRAMTR